MAKTKRPLKAVPETYLLCRYQRHAWKFVGLYTAQKGLVSLSYCRDCECWKEVRLSLKGTIEGTTYRYPSGYLMPGTGHRVYHQDVRQEVMSRFKRMRSREQLLEAAGLDFPNGKED